MVVSTGAVRMSVPIVPAQTIKQVTAGFISVIHVMFLRPTRIAIWIVSIINIDACLSRVVRCVLSCVHGLYLLQMVTKPLTSATVMTTTQTQQRLIMPATPLPQIQPNFTNLPPGTVLAPAPGGGNVGYAVVPAQYVTQVSRNAPPPPHLGRNETGSKVTVKFVMLVVLLPDYRVRCPRFSVSLCFILRRTHTHTHTLSLTMAERKQRSKVKLRLTEK